MSTMMGKRSFFHVLEGLNLELLFFSSLALAFTPTFIHLASAPGRTEQEAQCILILLVVAWLAWTRLPTLKKFSRSPAPIAGWVLLLAGLGTLVIARSQDIAMIEVASLIPVISGGILLSRGWIALRALAFPVFFLFFSVPLPGWLMDTLTVPLKMRVSDWVAQALYALNFPVAQNGVIIYVGTQELLVKDACAGMNSIFALSAVGILYVYEFVPKTLVRQLPLILAIVPITIFANFIRVLVLALLAFYFNSDAVEGAAHDLVGIGLFMVAMTLLLFFDFVNANLIRFLPSRPA